MKVPRLLCPFLGAVIGFVGTILLLRFLGRSGFGWVEVILKPGIAMAELTSKFSGSLAICILAGILTMTLIGALVGLAIDLLASPSDSK